MTENEQNLFDYIKTRTYNCPYCLYLQKAVLTNGLGMIWSYDGMICGSIIDMQIRYGWVLNGEPFDKQIDQPKTDWMNEYE